MKLGKIYTWGDPTFYVTKPDPGIVRTFIKLSLFVHHCSLHYQVIGITGHMIDQGDYVVFEFPRLRRILSYFNL